MKSIISLTVFLSIMFLTVASIASADVPTMMQYQGYLTNESGEPLNDTLSMTFAIYDDSTDGNVIWTEIQTDVVIDNGLFTVLLGSVNPVVDTVFADTERWFGITVAPDPEIAPRTRLITVPYAYRAATVDGATGGEIFGDVQLHSTFTVGAYGGDVGRIEVTDGTSATIVAEGTTGQVGIGTTNPSERLQVVGTIYSSSGGFKFPDGTIQTTAATGGGGADGWTDDGTVVRLETGTDSVGIGTTIPAEKLDVVGNVRVSGKATIGPGHANSGINSFVAGESNTASGSFCTVGGGKYNSAYGDWSTVGGGIGTSPAVTRAQSPEE